MQSQIKDILSSATTKLTIKHRQSVVVINIRTGSEHDDHYVSGYISTEGDYPRHDPELVKTVEDLGSEANGSHAHLKIKELKGNRYVIDEYDGSERVVEPDDINWVTVEE